MTGPLDGVRVVELCSAISGPFACKLLGDMGADVVKIERPGGVADRTRDLPYDTHGQETLTWRFLNYNTSKSSVTLDLKTEDGREIFEEVLRECDVLVENMRPGSMERLDFGFDRLQQLNPGLIYCSIKGYGESGPYSEMPALDTLIQGLSGFSKQVGSGDQPGRINVLVVDMLSGLYAAWSVAMALYERKESGVGQRVDVSMLNASISLLGHQLAEYAGERQNDNKPTYDSYFAPNGYFEAEDGYLALLLLQDHWSSFCKAVGRDAWAQEDHRYGTNESRLERRSALRRDIEAVLSERSVDAWIQHFDRSAGTIPVADVNDIPELIDHSQIRAQKAIIEREHPVLGEYVTPNVVPRFSRTGGEISDAPDLSDDTDRILAELGFDETERDRLRTDGVIE